MSKPRPKARGREPRVENPRSEEPETDQASPGSDRELLSGHPSPAYSNTLEEDPKSNLMILSRRSDVSQSAGHPAPPNQEKIALQTLM